MNYKNELRDKIENALKELKMGCYDGVNVTISTNSFDRVPEIVSEAIYDFVVELVLDKINEHWREQHR